MTASTHDMDSRRQSRTSQDNLQRGDHDHGLQDVNVEIVGLARPVRSVLRVTATLPGSAGGIDWSTPNTAFRIQLQTEQGEASRIYTVRRIDPVSGSFDFDIVLHPHASLMMQWAQASRVGDHLRISGPRPQGGFPALAGRRLALFADDTAIPALHALLKAAPAGLTGVGWIVTDDPAAFAELPTLPGLSLQHLDPAYAGPSPLLAQALALPDAAAHVVWGAGERDEMRSIRQHFRNVVGLGKDEVTVAGYWKRGATNTEIDQHRLLGYQRIIDGGGSLADYDDLAIGI